MNYDGENIGENVGELAPTGVYWHSYMMKSFGTGEQASREKGCVMDSTELVSETGLQTQFSKFDLNPGQHGEL